MSEKPLNAEQLETYEKTWKTVFSVCECALVFALIYLVAFLPSGSEKRVCYAVASIFVFACLYAAKSLRDAERVEALADAETLLKAHVGPDIGDVND